jgi:hypothetical protein
MKFFTDILFKSRTYFIFILFSALTFNQWQNDRKDIKINRYEYDERIEKLHSLQDFAEP